ncbi:MAG TPA: hypothetical protein VMS65_13925 [Polyangiaceae bacterium]|nr:hypothetical protein [Polyangiaceae bacterium]
MIARRFLRSAALGAVVTFFATLGVAQDQMGPGLMPGFGQSPGGQPEGAAPKPKKNPDEPELHAAPGASDQVVAPGGEPSLPESPLAIKEGTLERIGSDLDPDWEDHGRELKTTHEFYGPYYEEHSDRYSFKLAFPVWAERKQPSLGDASVTDRASLYGGLYYNRRSADRSDDIFFPLFWNMVDERKKARTTVIGPIVNRVTPDERDNWVAPLFFSGKRKHGGYTVIPPLLTYSQTDGRGGLDIVGPLFCSYKGGSHCDSRTAEDMDFGVAPLYFYGQSPEVKYEAIPPLLHYYRYNDRDLSWLNAWGPYWREHTQKRDMLHLLPLYWSIWGKNERHTTVLPLFHYGWHDKAWLFANPLFLMGEGEKGEDTFVTWGYARYRGRTTLDMITPLYWHYTDPDIELDQKLLFPFLFSRTSPRESTQAFFPFWAHSERYGVSETTFITPLFQHTHGVRGWETNLHPLLYVGRSATSTHTVLAPILFDFADPKSRTTVVVPAFFRFATEDSVSQLVGNVYYHEDKHSTGGSDWELHVFPAFSYGHTPDGHWWNVLYGLAGYTRRGNLVKVRAAWIPIVLSGEEN